MESVNARHQHHHQPQDQLPIGSSSSSSPLTTPSTCYGGAGIPSWTTTNITLCNDEFTGNYNGMILNSRATNDHHIDLAITSPNSSMIQGSFPSESSHELHHFARIKQELSSMSDHSFTELLSSSPSSTNEDSQKEMSEKLLLQTISPGFPMFPTSDDLSSFNRSSSMPSLRGSFTQIYPSINVSSLSQACNSSASPSPSPSSLEMNLQALDLLSAARFGGNSCVSLQPQHENYNLGMYDQQERHSFNLHHQLQLSCQKPPYYGPNINDISSGLPKETKGAKGGSNLTEAKAAKKPRLGCRSACPPFKVRKEKLGDRISALQQLVAPFGKTDTASVLMEAIGYIKFLQNQVETLSVPYMKSSRNRSSGRSKQGGSKIEDSKEEGNRDLRSRGLCLVPLSCMSFVTNDGGGGIWPPPSYGGAT